MKKGVSMPINAIVLLAIAAVVIVVLLMTFVMTTGSKTSEQDISAFMTTNCYRFKNIDNCGLSACATGGDPSSVAEQYAQRSVTVGGRKYTLGDVCQKMVGTSDIAECCGCKSGLTCS